MIATSENKHHDFFWIYDWIVKLARFVVGFILPRDRIQAIEKIRTLSKSKPKSKSTRRIWFHAASVGELESLWSLVERFTDDPDYEVILTVFSQSAYEHVKTCMKRLKMGQVTYADYSPFEGDWAEGLRLLEPDLFITAKYEAWPDLWHSLSLLRIPLCIVGAKPRSSLLWAKRVLSITRSKLPSLVLVSFSSANEERLKEHFPESEIIRSSDPRWDRVRARLIQKHPRVSQIEESSSSLPRPWLIAGSSWESDWIEWRGKLDSQKFSGTLFIAPHKIDPGSIKAQEILLRDLGWTPIRTTDRSGILPAGKIAVIVDEMGFLAELYRIADLAYVGGGFGSSLHSTIEPAVHGLPIFAGPIGAEKFDEIESLESSKQLNLLRTSKEWSDFRVASERVLTAGEREAWKAGVQGFFGSSEILANHLKSKLPQG